MSVILDALRRSRKRTSGTVPPPASVAPRRVPAGLGLTGSSSTTSGSKPTRTRLFGLAALLVIGLGVWAAIQVARTLINS